MIVVDLLAALLAHPLDAVGSLRWRAVGGCC
jgi:hypothetical protein